MCMFSLSNAKGKSRKKRNAMKWRKKCSRAAKHIYTIRIYVCALPAPHKTHSHIHIRSTYTRERYPQSTSVCCVLCVCTNINILVVYWNRPSRIDFRNIGWIKKIRGAQRRVKENSKTTTTTPLPPSSYPIWLGLGDFNVRFFSLCLLFSFSFFLRCVCWLQCAPPKKHTQNANNRHTFIER